MATELVITGFGAVGSFGRSPSDLVGALRENKPLVWPARRLGCETLAAEVRDFDLAHFRRTAKGHRAPRLSQYALAAAAQAIDAAGLERGGCRRDDVAIVFGTGNGPSEVVARNLEAMTRNGLGAVEPLSFQESVFNAPASLISIEYGFRGPLLAVPMGWAAGGYAIALAADLICAGHAEVVLVVASDEVSALAHEAMCALGLARGAPGRPSPGARPPLPVFPSEGGAAAVIETRGHAERRSAIPLLELAGYGMSSDVFGVGPKGTGACALMDAMRHALADSQPCPQPARVYAGSYCTEDADRAEAEALLHVLGRQAREKLINLRHVIGEAKAPMALFNLMAAQASLDGPADLSVSNAFWVNGANASVLVRRPQ